MLYWNNNKQQYISKSVFLSVCLPACLSVCKSAYLSVWLLSRLPAFMHPACLTSCLLLACLFILFLG
jgi:hypothetical protein